MLYDDAHLRESRQLRASRVLADVIPHRRKGTFNKKKTNSQLDVHTGKLPNRADSMNAQNLMVEGEHQVSPITIISNSSLAQTQKQALIKAHLKNQMRKSVDKGSTQPMPLPQIKGDKTQRAAPSGSQFQDFEGIRGSQMKNLAPLTEHQSTAASPSQMSNYHPKGAHSTRKTIPASLANGTSDVRVATNVTMIKPANVKTS